MKAARKIYVVGGGIGYANWMEGQVVPVMDDADLVVFTGGEDVHPSIYHRKQHPATSANLERDTREIAKFNEAQAKNKKVIGICRGSQLLCALAGGQLIQDQENPGFYHQIEAYDGKTYTMTSTHHQAQLPWNLLPKDYRVLAWTRNVSPHHDGPSPGIEMVYAGMPCQNREVEICFYPHIKALAIQGHPEMMYSKTGLHAPIAESIAFCRGLLDQHMEGTL